MSLSSVKSETALRSRLVSSPVTANSRHECHPCRKRRLHASRATSLRVVGLKERALIERRSWFSVRHRRDGTIMDTVDRPMDDRRGGLTARAALAFPSARAGLANWAAAA